VCWRGGFENPLLRGLLGRHGCKSMSMGFLGPTN
jgi:hypothetical protein